MTRRIHPDQRPLRRPLEIGERVHYPGLHHDSGVIVSLDPQRHRCEVLWDYATDTVDGSRRSTAGTWIKNPKDCPDCEMLSRDGELDSPHDPDGLGHDPDRPLCVRRLPRASASRATVDLLVTEASKRWAALAPDSDDRYDAGDQREGKVSDGQ